MSNEREIEKEIVKYSVNRRKQTYLFEKKKENCANWELSHVFLSELKMGTRGKILFIQFDLKTEAEEKIFNLKTSNFFSLEYLYPQSVQSIKS